MAVSFEPFSIREYTAKMRAADLTKCWPFDGGGEEVAMPQMHVRRFRWWADEVAALPPQQHDEEEEEERRKPARRKKKRSIVELFASVPQVDAADEGLEEELEEEEGKKKKLVEEIDRKKSEAKKRKRKKKKKKTDGVLQMEICTVDKKKDKGRKTNITSLSIYQLLPGAVRKKKLRKFLGNSVHSHKKRSSAKILLEKEKVKIRKLCSSDRKVDIDDFPPQSILKKPLKKSFKLEERPTIHQNNGDLLKSACKLKRHVTFSGKDDVLGRNTYPVEDVSEESHLEIPQLASDIGISQEGYNKLRGSEEPQLVHEREVHDTNGLSNKKMNFIFDRMQLTDVSCATGSTAPSERSSKNPFDKRETNSVEFVDLNHCMEVSNNESCLKSMCSGSLSSQIQQQNNATLSSHQIEGSKRDIGYIAEDISHMTRQELNLQISLSSGASSEAPIRNPDLRPSGSCVLTNNPEGHRKDKDSFHGVKNNDEGLLPEVQLQHPVHCSCKDVMSSISSSTGSNKSVDTRLTADCVSAFKNMVFAEDYVGLPLNSRGEFVKVQPCTGTSPGEVPERWYLGEDSLAAFSVPGIVRPKSGMDRGSVRIDDHATPFVVDSSFGLLPGSYRSPVMPVTSGLNFMQFPGLQRTSVTQNSGTHWDTAMPMYHDQYYWGQYHQSQNVFQLRNFPQRHDVDPVLQPTAETTLRLMGKTVSLDKTSEQCMRRGKEKMWPDKVMTAQEDYSSRISNKAVPSQFPVGAVAHGPSSIPHGGRMRPLETPLSSSVTQPVELRFGHMHWSNQPFKGSISTSLESHNSTMNNNSQQAQQRLTAIVSKQPVPYAHSMTRCNEAELGHHMTRMPNYSQNGGQHLPVSSTHCKHSQSFSFGTLSTSSPPNRYRNFVGLSSAQPSAHLPQWPVNVVQRAPVSSFMNHNSTAAHHPLIGPQQKLPCCPSVHSSSPGCCPPHRSANAQIGGSNPADYPVYLADYSLKKFTTPGQVAIEKTSTKQGGVKLRPNLGVIDSTNRSNRGPAEKDGVMRGPKKPRLAIKNNSSAQAVPEKNEDLHGIGSGKGTSKFTPCEGNVQEVNFQKKSSGMTAACSSSSGRKRSGPVKLIPGAKHVLKPSSDTDEENSIPLHATIPFAAKSKLVQHLCPRRKLQRFSDSSWFQSAN